MKISHEVPRCLLTASTEFNDYDYCLPHLLDQDEEYLQYFKDARDKGRYVIMDNSLHELGEAYDYDRLRYWVHELKPNEFIVPDVWMKGAETAAQAKYWKQFVVPEETKKIAVIQGEDKNQAYLCASLLQNLGYDKLCVSYGATWYNDFFPHSNPDMGKALGRVRFVQGLLKIEAMKDVKLHLLGCSIPQEFGWYDNNPQIESIDTSNPVMAALEGIEYGDIGLNYKPKANMNDHFNVKFKDIEYGSILYNVNKFRKINNIKTKQL
jgi:hypothetical protein